MFRSKVLCLARVAGAFANPVLTARALRTRRTATTHSIECAGRENRDDRARGTTADPLLAFSFTPRTLTTPSVSPATTLRTTLAGYPHLRNHQDVDPQAAKKTKKKASSKKPDPAPNDAFDDPVDILLRPANQLDLSEKQLEEEITKQLTANNPNAPSNIARYNTAEKAFKFEPMVDQLVMHYATNGFLLHNESDEATRQVSLVELETKTMADWVLSIDPAAKKKADGADGGSGDGEKADGDTKGDGDDAKEERDDDRDDADAGERVDEPGKDLEHPGDDSKQLRNQFNFADRASQVRPCARFPNPGTPFLPPLFEGPAEGDLHIQHIRTVLPLTLVTVQTDYPSLLSIHRPIHAQHSTADCPPVITHTSYGPD